MIHTPTGRVGGVSVHREAGAIRRAEVGDGRGAFHYPAILRNCTYMPVVCRFYLDTIDTIFTIYTMRTVSTAFGRYVSDCGGSYGSCPDGNRAFNQLLIRVALSQSHIDRPQSGSRHGTQGAQSVSVVLQFVTEGVEHVPAGFGEFDLLLAADGFHCDVAIGLQRVDDIGVQQGELGFVVGGIGLGEKG